MDDQQNLYAQDTVTRLVNLYEATFGTTFHRYFDAFPLTPPGKDDYPLVAVQQIHTKAIIGPTSTDDVPETIVTEVMINAADDAGSQNVRTATMRHLQNLVQGQDPVTFDYLPNTFLYCLRTHLTLLQSSGSIWLIDSDVDIKYDITQPKDMPLIALAEITLTTQRRVIVPGRT